MKQLNEYYNMGLNCTIKNYFKFAIRNDIIILFYIK